jgi:hypothetical protein
MDAKLCPDGVNYVGRDGNRNCEWQLCPGEMDTCMPYLCQDGTSVNKCAEDGTVINYFAAPCLTHGGELDSSQSFSDVPALHPNAEAIAYLKASGIIEGYADGTYKPDMVINRAEFVKILVGTKANESAIRACYEEVEPAHWAFTERMHDEWYAPFVCYAKKFRLVDGYPDGSFWPASNINFVEAAKILVRVFVGDIEADPVWYKPYVEKLSSLNAIPRDILTFAQPITRGDMAEMIYRLKTGNTDKPSRTYEELVPAPPTPPDSLKFGMKFGDLFYTSDDSVRYESPPHTVSSYTFTGRVELTGKYTNYALAPPIFDVDALSVSRLPFFDFKQGSSTDTYDEIMRTGTKGDRIELYPRAASESLFPDGTYGTATIIVTSVTVTNGARGSYTTVIESVSKVKVQGKTGPAFY